MMLAATLLTRTERAEHTLLQQLTSRTGGERKRRRNAVYFNLQATVQAQELNTPPENPWQCPAANSHCQHPCKTLKCQERGSFSKHRRTSPKQTLEGFYSHDHIQPFVVLQSAASCNQFPQAPQQYCCSCISDSLSPTGHQTSLSLTGTDTMSYTKDNRA